MSAIRNVVVRIAADISQLQKGLKNASGALKKTGDNMKKIGGNLTKTVSMPLTNAGGLVVKMAADFEKSMSNVQANSGRSGKALGELRQAALDMGKKTSKSATDAADALNYMALAGWDNQQMLTSLEPILRLSEAGNLDLARTSDLVTDSMSAFKLEAGDIGEYLDVVAQTSRNANTNIDAMLEAVIQVGGSMAGVKIGAKEAALALSVLGDNGIKASEAGVSLSSLLANFKNPVGQAAEALDELNVSAFDSRGEFIGIEALMLRLQQATKNLTTQERERLLGMVAGKTQINTLNALMDITKKKYDETALAIENSDGALNEMSLTMQNNFYGALSKLQSSLANVAIQLGNVLLPYLKKGAAIANRFSDIFGKLPNSVKVATVVLGLFSIVIPPIVLAAGFLISSIGSIIGVLAGLTAPIIAVVGVLSVLGAGLAALSVYFVKLYKDNENFKNAVNSLVSVVVERFNNLKSVFDKVLGGILAFYQKHEKAINGFVDLFNTQMTLWVNFFKNIIGADFELAFNDLIKLFQNSSETLSYIISTLTPVWRDLLSKAKDAMIKIAIKIKDKLIEKFGILRERLINKIEETRKGLVKKFELIRENLPKIIETTKRRIKAKMDLWVTELPKKVEEITNKIISEFFGDEDKNKKPSKNIDKALNKAKKKVEEKKPTIMSTIIDLTKSIIKELGKLAIKSLPAIAKFMLNISLEIIKNIPKVVKAIGSGLGKAVKGAMDKIATKAYESGSKIVEKLKSGITSKIESAKKAMSNLASGLMSFLPQSPAKEGPLKGLGTAGEQIVMQLSNAMEKAIPSLELATGKLTGSIMKVFEKDTSKVGQMFDKLRNNIRGAYDEMESDAERGLNDLASTVQGALKEQAKQAQEANEKKIKTNIEASKEELKNQEDSLKQQDRNLEVAHKNGLAQETLFAMNKKRKQITDRMAQLKSEIVFGENMLTTMKESYDKQTSEQELYNRTSYLLQAENQESLLSLLEEYAPNWQDQGKSFAEKFMDGFRGIHTDMATELNRVMNQVNNVLGVNVEGVVNETYKLEQTWAKTIQSMKSNSVSWDREYNLMKSRIQAVKDKLAADKKRVTGKSSTTRKQDLERIAERNIKNIESRFRKTVSSLETSNVQMGTQLGLTKRDGAWYLPSGEKAYDAKSDTPIEVPVYLDGQKIARGIMPHVVRDARFKGGVN